MIEHKLIDLFVAYVLKRNYSDLHMDVSLSLLFSHLLLLSFLIFSAYTPTSSDSIVFLITALYLCDATILGEVISFSYSFSSACRLLIIFLIVLVYLSIRFLQYFHVFRSVYDFFHYYLKIIFLVVFQYARVL